ncbi:MFS transporter [Mesomycoplasma ovipneumoniae]|uniref:MFS transporter n=1 Tax=Mesomycoplasma ovipneumoniae TaxID=29562 RepID=UPI002965629B|nr:MFS transporter [Mesomycoplasma ovipneumoniae]MDW2924842.1 MFS transporter [Mesomycoplasma ovipneumoniae]
MTIFFKNSIKFTSSLSTSLIGSEAFKFSSSLYIFKITGDFWLVTILYLLIQIPNLVVYLFSSKIVQKWKNDKIILLISDILSVFCLAFLLIIFFSLANSQLFTFSIILILVNTLLGFIHAFRFIYLKNIVYYLANNEKQMQNINVFSSFATAMGFLISAVFALVIYSRLDFYWMVLFNMATYSISGLLYFWLKLNAKKFDFALSQQENFKENDKKISTYKWVFVLAGHFIVAIFFLPRTTLFPPVFEYINSQSQVEIFNYQQLATWLNIGFSLASVLGTIVSFLILNKTRKKISIILLLAGLLILGWIWPFVAFIKNLNVQFYSYMIITSFNQFIFSLFFPTFSSLSYLFFSKEKFHVQNGISLVTRAIFYTLVTIATTATFIYLSFYFSFLIFMLLISVFALIVIFSYWKIKKLTVKKVKIKTTKS